MKIGGENGKNVEIELEVKRRKEDEKKIDMREGDKLLEIERIEREEIKERKEEREKDLWKRDDLGM